MIPQNNRVLEKKWRSGALRKQGCGPGRGESGVEMVI
jgi:hypothetical protein